MSSPVYASETALELETIVDRQLILPQEVREFIVVNDATARAILGETDRVHVLAGTFKAPASYYDSRDLHASVLRLKRAGESIAADLGMDFDVRLPKATAITVFQNVASPLRAIFGVFAVLALSVTGLLIYSIVSVAVEERIREYAILRTVGARRIDIFRLVLSESVFLCWHRRVARGARGHRGRPDHRDARRTGDARAGRVGDARVLLVEPAADAGGRHGVVDRQRADSRPAGHALAHR